MKRPLVYRRTYQGVVCTLSESEDLQGASACHTMPTTILTDLAQIVMDFAIAINAAAFQPRMLDQTQQSLVVCSPCTLRLRQPSAITTGMDFQRQAMPSTGIVTRALLDKGVLQLHTLAKYAAAFFKMSRSSVTRLSSARRRRSSAC